MKLVFKYQANSIQSLSNLSAQRIYMSCVDRFNDPFECRCEVVSGFPAADPSAFRFQEILRAWGFDDPTAEIALDNYADYAESLYEFPIDPVVAQARICCFSKRGDNMLVVALRRWIARVLSRPQCRRADLNRTRRSAVVRRAISGSTAVYRHGGAGSTPRSSFVPRRRP